MKRRDVLALVASSSVVFSGCVFKGSDSEGGSPQDPTESGNTTGTNQGQDAQLSPEESPDIPETTGQCGPAAQPLSELLISDKGPDCDVQQRTPKIRFGNERTSDVVADVRIEQDGTAVWEDSIDVAAGEYIEKNPDLPADQLDSVRVILTNETDFVGSWDEDSCRLHGVAITEEGVETGLIKPVNGSIDGSWACYPGQTNEFRVVNSTDETQQVTASVVNHCDESMIESSIEMPSGNHETVTESIITGGRYSIVVDVENGPGATTEFGDHCGRFRASIQTDEIHFSNMIY